MTRHQARSRTGDRQPKPKDTLLRRLCDDTPTTSELLGVLMYNVQSTGSDGDFLDEPISIGQLDQQVLEAMRLIRMQKDYDTEQEARYYVSLTKLGAYVTQQAVFMSGSEKPGALPRVDTRHLFKLLANGFTC